MLKISDLARDTVKTEAVYRGHTVEFTFRPGAYTTQHANGWGVVDVVAACVTEWNIEDVDPTDTAKTNQLPWGLMLAVFHKFSALAALDDTTKEDKTGEADAS